MATKGKKFRENRDFEKKVIHTLMDNDAVSFLEETMDSETMLTDKDKAKEFLENTKEKLDELLSDLDKL
ncbi:MAG: hypothetical protein IKP60_10400 [Treponema sp.]|nr:hypothetical protein [Treponema sp.]